MIPATSMPALGSSTNASYARKNWMKRGEPRKTKVNHSAGLRSQTGPENRAKATAVARKKPSSSASAPK